MYAAFKSGPNEGVLEGRILYKYMFQTWFSASLPPDAVFSVSEGPKVGIWKFEDGEKGAKFGLQIHIE